MRFLIRVFTTLSLCTVLLGCFGVGGQEHNRLSSTVTVSPRAPLERYVIAVADFDSTHGEKYNDGVSNYTPFSNSGVRMADVIATRLMALTQCRLVERSQLKHVLEELKLQMTDLVNLDKLREVGRLLGADAVVFGRAEGWTWANRFGWGNSLDAAFRLVDVKTGEVLWATEGAVVRINTTDDVYQLLATDICEKLSVQMQSVNKNTSVVR